ncbi:alpha-1A adrenergic receptor-like [Aplysia californica]|uniref:Alpha-1A adrenergic receptor-like n=1 Tax=Aplysia californica TaxID=6500 RepID=A0ABM0ZXX2_APLCA|nr:alpha-1A adrenergic receptor-like [Aplysia californica]
MDTVTALIGGQDGHRDRRAGIVSNELQRYMYFNVYLVGVDCSSISNIGTITLLGAIKITLFIYTFIVSCYLPVYATHGLGWAQASEVNETKLVLWFSDIRDEVEVMVDWIAVMYVGFAWPRAMFLDISMLTTVFISLERCLCVIIPLHFKGTITLARAIKIISFIYAFIVSCYLPVYATHGLGWAPASEVNGTKLVLWFSDIRKEVEVVSNTVNGIIIPTVSHLTVIMCAYVMMLGLRSTSNFRSKANTKRNAGASNSTQHIVAPSKILPTSKRDGTTEEQSHYNVRPESESRHAGTSKSSTLCGKERRAVKLVTLVAIVFIFCTLPQVAMVYARRFIEELAVNRRYHNIHWTLFGVVYFVGGINSCVNMFLYLYASSRYRNIFLSMVDKKLKGASA